MRHVLIIGGGGREHALAWKIAQSPRVERISVAPGNGGTARFAQNVDIDATDIVSLLDYAETEGVTLAVVGPEDPLAMGIVDQFEAAKIPIFGPSRQAALIETSKSYAKQIMTKYGVPTSPYEIFEDLDPALDYLASHPVDNLVIKADGLARGKGTFLPRSESDADGILRALLQRDLLGRAGRKVIIEDRMIGDELSIMAFTDGRSMALMPAVRDHKRLYDRDVGPNTGGMGAYAPAPTLTHDLSDLIHTRIMQPILDGLRDQGHLFKGVLYIGVALTPDGPMALELNSRIGDPGAQVVLPLLETDLLDVIEGCLHGTLKMVDVRWKPQAAVSVVMATPNYPDRDDPGIPIIEGQLPEDVLLFHAGTRIAQDGALVTTGGRVLSVTGLGPDLPQAMIQAYDAVRRVHFDGAHYRTDIGSRAVWS
jgi:phosphoribosylamine--glycine ligase